MYKMIISITHEDDLDGIGSQAIVKRYLNIIEGNKEIILNYAHYTNFLDKLTEILSAEKLPSKLFITDIGFNKEFEELFPLLKNAKDGKDGKCKVYWFDHHVVDDDMQAKLRDTIELYINDEIRCAAEIVKDYYLPEDEIAQRIASLARDTDFGTKKFLLANKLQSIIAYNKGDDLDENKSRIVELLSEGTFENDWFEEQLKKLREWDEKQSELVFNRVKIVEIESLGKIAISHANIGGGRTARLLQAKYPDVKAYIGVDARFNDVILFSNFINFREVARSFGGGGHLERAGFRSERIFSKNNEITPRFIQDLKDILKQFKL